MSRREENKRMKTKNCSSQSSNETSDCGNRTTKNTKSCGNGKKCK